MVTCNNKIIIKQGGMLWVLCIGFCHYLFKIKISGVNAPLKNFKNQKSKQRFYIDFYYFPVLWNRYVVENYNCYIIVDFQKKECIFDELLLISLLIIKKIYIWVSVASGPTLYYAHSFPVNLFLPWLQQINFALIKRHELSSKKSQMNFLLKIR